MEPETAGAALQQPTATAGLRTGPEQRYAIEFTATGGEYFRIWIVNLALTVLTLGIYSAWAKVRTRRYFYGNTRIAGEGFEYRARPLAILKGRLIAFALLAVFYGTGMVSPVAQLVLWIPLILAAPWLLVRSLAFNAYNTAYRNIRFRFSGTYGGLLKVVLLYGWMILLGFLYPYFKRRLVRFVAEHHAYGTTPFALGEPFRKAFIRAYAVAYGLALLGGVILIALFATLGFSVKDGSKASAALGLPLAFLLFYGGLFFLFAYVRARTLNALWGNLTIGPVRIESTLRARRLLWITVSNLFAIAFTLGLATPWATVRTKRYRAECTALVSAAPLDGFIQAEAQQVSVAGEEAADLFDIDIAL